MMQIPAWECFTWYKTCASEKPKIISVANLISLSGLEKKNYLVMYPANNSAIHFSSTIQSL